MTSTIKAYMQTIIDVAADLLRVLQTEHPESLVKCGKRDIPEVLQMTQEMLHHHYFDTATGTTKLTLISIGAATHLQGTSSYLDMLSKLDAPALDTFTNPELLQKVGAVLSRREEVPKGWPTPPPAPVEANKPLKDTVEALMQSVEEDMKKEERTTHCEECAEAEAREPYAYYLEGFTNALMSPQGKDKHCPVSALSLPRALAFTLGVTDANPLRHDVRTFVALEEALQDHIGGGDADDEEDDEAEEEEDEDIRQDSRSLLALLTDEQAVEVCLTAPGHRAVVCIIPIERTTGFDWMDPARNVVTLKQLLARVTLGDMAERLLELGEDEQDSSFTDWLKPVPATDA